MDRGRLLIEDPLDDLLANFRRVTDTGSALPVSHPAILAAHREPNATQFVVQREPEAFAAELARNGATVVDSTPLSLNEIFLELCRKDEGREDAEPYREVLR
jgi:ABC-2 type transport system ATP-binding protein